MATFKTLVLMVLTAVLVNLAFLVAAPHKDTSARPTQPVYERVMREKELRCAYTVYPPLFDKDVATGKLSGVAFDLMEALGEQMGIKISWVEEVGTDNAFAGLDTGRYDAPCLGYWVNPHRANVGNFTTPWYYQGLYAFAKPGDARFVASLQAINDPAITVAVQDGEMSQVVAARDYPNAKTLAQPGANGPSMRFVDVASGRADLTFNEMNVFEKYNASNPGVLVQAHPAPVRINAAALAVPRSEPDLLELLNTNISLLHNLGVVDRILAKYDPEAREFLRLARPYK